MSDHNQFILEEDVRYSCNAHRPDQVPAVFSPKFQQTLVNSLSQQDRVLHPAAKKAVNRYTNLFFPSDRYCAC
jgi:hypothetical protein